MVGEEAVQEAVDPNTKGGEDLLLEEEVFLVVQCQEEGVYTYRRRLEM
jgi:hypothetical protein